ncbi:MAG: twin-arginine translocase TatA/TatE family subunit [Bdellovibrionaceae bacterium]|nr:twin-arginine translocase TatA/TatE family subunit [Pseudobdellovibrionaceae bacterium]
MSPSIWQILIVLLIVVVLFGANRLPNLGKSLGQAIRGFKKGISEDEIDITETAKNEQIQEGEKDTRSQKEKVEEKSKQ